MRTLLLMRHAAAEMTRAGQRDRDRRLNAQGRREAGWAAETLRELDLSVDVILVSPSRRTIETAEAVRASFGAFDAPDTRIIEDLYLASAVKIVEEIRQIEPQAKSILVVAHNPGLQELACLLASGVTAQFPGQMMTWQFPTGSVARYNISADWRMIGAKSDSSVQFVRLLMPTVL